MLIKQLLTRASLVKLQVSQSNNLYCNLQLSCFTLIGFIMCFVFDNLLFDERFDSVVMNSHAQQVQKFVSINISVFVSLGKCCCLSLVWACSVYAEHEFIKKYIIKRISLSDVQYPLVSFAQDGYVWRYFFISYYIYFITNLHEKN